MKWGCQEGNFYSTLLDELLAGETYRGMELQAQGLGCLICTHDHPQPGSCYVGEVFRRITVTCIMKTLRHRFQNQNRHAVAEVLSLILPFDLQHSIFLSKQQLLRRVLSQPFSAQMKWIQSRRQVVK